MCSSDLINELFQDKCHNNGENKHFEDGKSNNLLIDEALPVRIKEEGTQEHHGKRARHAPHHTDRTGKDIGQFDAGQIDNNGKDAGYHARINEVLPAKRFLGATTALDGFNDIGEKEQVEGNEKNRHINERFLSINSIHHGNAHEADVRKDDHDVHDAFFRLAIVKDPRNEEGDRKSTRLNSSHPNPSRMPSSA